MLRFQAMRWPWLVLVVGCRIGFDDVLTDANGSSDDDVGASDAFVAPNRVFVDTGTYSGSLGGLAGADSICATAATNAGLAGTFIALLSTSNVNARDRLAGSRGWTLVDGTPIADTVESLFDQHALFNPIRLTAGGAPRVAAPWSGSSVNGKTSTATCLDWTDGSFSEQGTSGDASSPRLGGYTTSCNNQWSLYCFETGRVAFVAPPPRTGRVAFVSRYKRSSPDNIGTLDSVCQSEAAAAGLSGTFLVALTTSTASIASRFPADTRPWIRPDGTIVAKPTAALFQATLSSFVNQFADGQYVFEEAMWTGVSTSAEQTTGIDATCNDWSTAGATQSTAGAPDHANSNFWMGMGASCNNPYHVLCLEL